MNNNPDLIHILERNEIQFDPKLLFKESVKCHHNEIANYIIENLINQQQRKNWRKNISKIDNCN